LVRIINMNISLSNFLSNNNLSENFKIFDIEEKNMLDMDYVGSNINFMTVKEIVKDRKFNVSEIYVSISK